MTLLMIPFAAAKLAAEDRPSERRAVVMDTDIGDDIDDAFAVALAVRSPELEVRGITTVFKDAHTRALLACRLLEEMGQGQIPVAAGAPPQATPEKKGQLQYGLEGNFKKRPLEESAVDFLYRQFKAHPGELTMLAVGPLTNVAKLLTEHPDCKPWIKEIVLMGGAVRVGYKKDSPPDVEWNIKCDIPAAQTVFSAGVPLVVAPLDATATLRLDTQRRERIFDSAAPEAKTLAALYKLWGNPTPVLFDNVAVTLCHTDKFCKLEPLHISVNDKGYTPEGPGQPNAKVATSINVDAYLKWYIDRVIGPPASK